MVLLKKDLEEGFVKIYQLYSDHVFRAVMIYTKDIQSAQDIVQSVFLTLWEKREELHRIVSIRDFLFIAARNRIFNEIKRTARRMTVSTPWEKEEIIADGAPSFEQKDIQRLLQEAVDRLPDRQKQVYMMYEEGQHSYDDMARFFQLSRLTIKRHLEEARHSIRRYLRIHIPELLLVSPILVFPFFF